MLGQPMRGGHFGRPAAKNQRRKKPNKSRTKLPAEFAEFRLEDGQFLGEVLGEDFFEPEGVLEFGRQFPEETRESLHDGNYQPAMFLGRDRERFSSPAEEREIIFDRGGVNTQWIAANGRPAQSDAIVSDAGMASRAASPKRGSDIPVPRARLARADDSAADEAGNTSRFRIFDLPLTGEGKVDTEALAPGAVYRIPVSAGGGTGQWKSGMFYNFDQKGDWNFRTAGDLDAYSGASDAPTPEERAEELDKIFSPAARLDADGIETFRKKSGYSFTRSEDGYTLTSPSGQELFDLADEDAAELARQWNPEIARQIQMIGLIWRDDLKPAEKRALLEEFIDVGEADAGRVLNKSEYAAHIAKSAERNIARRRLMAFDTLAEAMERGASDEEIGTLLGEFHAAMLPEVLGPQRFVRELMLDLAPLLGNIRSVRHLQNDIAEVDEAIETGDWSDAALASGMAILDFVGILPGGNLVKEGGKLTGSGIIRAVPHLDALLAERTIRRFKAQWEFPKGPVPGAKEFFGEKALDGLTESQIRSLDGLIRNRFGIAGGENYLWTLGKRMDPTLDPNIDEQFSVPLNGVLDAISETRKYDLRATFASDVLSEQNALLGRLGKWVVGARGQNEQGSLLPSVFELKTGDLFKPPRERIPDDYFKGNFEEAAEKGFRSVEDLRMHIEDIPMEFILVDFPRHLNKHVRKGKLSPGEKDLLLLAMNRMYANGILGIPLDKYATLLARLGSGTARRIEADRDESLPAISPYRPS